jgi:hypothetical protein
VRVTVQLTDAPTARSCGPSKYDDRLTDIFAVQDRIARGVAGALRHQPAADRPAQSLRKPTNDLDAYDLLLRARAQANEATAAGNRMARETLER